MRVPTLYVSNLVLIKSNSLKLYEICLELIKKYSTCCTGNSHEQSLST